MPNATPSTVVAFADAPATPSVVGPGFWARAARQLRSDPAAIVATAFLVALVAVALLAPVIAPYDPTAALDIVALKTRPPSAMHWFGTDPASRDVLSRVIDGTRVSLSISVLAVLLASLLGTLYGAVAGYSGGALGSLLMRLVDACLAIPRILLLLVVIALWGTLSAGALILLLGLTGWFGVSRLVRAEVLLVRHRDFITAARASGMTPGRVLVRHVLPQVLAPVFVAATLGIGNIIVVEAGLSFLGHGIPQPRASWGSIIADGREVLASAWWVSLSPGVALAATVLAVNVIAERLRQALSTRQLHAG
jgi:peptide/nickel transport system permease protein